MKWKLKSQFRLGGVGSHHEIHFSDALKQLFYFLIDHMFTFFGKQRSFRSHFLIYAGITVIKCLSECLRITKTDLVMWQVWLRFLAFAMWAAVLLLIKSCGKNDSRYCGKHARDRQKVESNSSKSHLSFCSGRNYTKQTICRCVVLISAQIFACFTMSRSAVVPLPSLHN